MIQLAMLQSQALEDRMDLLINAMYLLLVGAGTCLVLMAVLAVVHVWEALRERQTVDNDETYKSE